MARIRTSRARIRTTVAVTAAVGLVVGLASGTGSAGAAPASAKLAHDIATSQHSLSSMNGTTPARLPKGVPAKGRYAFLLKLDTPSTTTVYNRTKAAKGVKSGKAAAKAHLRTVDATQDKVIADLPGKTSVLYRTHAVMAGLAVVTDVKNYNKLRSMSDVAAVYPITPKTASNAYAVPLQGAPPAWQAYGDRGENSIVAIIDTGIDYTHANFGGPGTTAAYDAALASDTAPADPASYDHNKFDGTTIGADGNPVGFFDFAGDDYDATPTDPGFQPVPHPDPNPLDCNSHGSHVAGTVAGYGENADGSTYTGKYNRNTPFETMRIGPGMAPEAKLYAYRVFGCAGSTNVVGEALDKAMDPNGDGDTSDHVDVVNMSLGSDFGSPQDGDSVATEAASAAGVTVVVASGNAGDLYDAGGSPGDAPSALTAAASQDASSVVDALNVGSPLNQPYAAERSIAYDWATKPDLTGDVVKLAQPGNADGCVAVTEPYKSQIAGHIAFVEWTDVDANRRCGSAARGLILRNAGASGFIFADDEDNFAAGITGDTDIPGVLVSKTGGDAIRTALQSGPVTIDGTTANGFRQLDPSLDDTIANFSSRGIGDTNNVKPDVAAVGASVFSTGMGTGNQGLNDSGTSMATPMVAGTAALVRSRHDGWTPEQVKADIMNTADADVFTGTDHTGKKFAPQRVGAGRIDVKKALDNTVLAYNAEDHGSVSASFGPLEVTGTAVVTRTKAIKVQNTGVDAASYDVSYKARTTIPGVSYSVSPSTVTVGPRASATVTLTLTVDPTMLTKTIDPTVDRLQGGLPREYQADASGLVMFNGDGVPNLRVPAYSAPRPASVMTQPATISMPGGATPQAFLPLSGQQVSQGSGKTAIQSIVAGFELQATSDALPDCSTTVTTGCVDFADERSADLKYVGVTSDANQVSAIGGDPIADGLTYFSITTQHPWRTQAGIQEFDILIDSNRDGKPDFVVFNTRFTGTDVMVAELADLSTNEVVDAEAINDSLGDTDTAEMNSDTLVMPVLNAALGLSAGNTRINYAVASFTAYQSAPLDSVGLDAMGNLHKPLSFDPANPGVAVFGSYNGSGSALLFADSPGSVLAIKQNKAAYRKDGGQGALIVHFHNVVGNKAQVVGFGHGA